MRRFIAASANAVRQRIADRVDGRAAVLCYHRVATLEHDPQLLAVTPERFAAQLDMLAAKFKPLPLGSLVADPPRGAVAITFDDGYADNLEHAAPALAAAGVPATVFVTTGYIGGAREFWWDELERLLIVRQPRGELRAGGRRWQLDSADDVELAYRDIQGWLRPLPTATIEDVLGELRAFAAEPPEGAPRASHRQLDVDELRRLAASPGIEIGAHTVTHPSLASQPADVQRSELEESRHRLEEWLDRRVESMSYPFGTLYDHSRTTHRIAREAGYAYAAANFPGLVGRRSSRWSIPRILVRDWEPDELERRLARIAP